MDTDIRGAIESAMYGFLVLTGSMQLENVGDYVLSSDAHSRQRRGSD
jgi:hypothetical protein